MAYLFYPPPQPTQPPPHVPIPAQGQQPPLGPTGLAVCASVVRQSWEPPPPLPTQRPLTIAPLTLVYGQQPPPGPTASDVYTYVVRGAWEPPWTPPQRAAPVAPLTLAYGDQPPTYSVAVPMALALSWVPPDPPPRQLPLTVAPLTLVYGQQPPKGPTALAVAAAVTVASWPAPWYPAQAAPRGPIPRQGDQPPPQPHPNALLAAWVTPFQMPQVLPGTAAWNVPAVVASVPPPASGANLGILLRSWQAPDPLPVQRLLQVAPLTLVYGDQPPAGPTAADVISSITRWAWEPAPQQPPVLVSATVAAVPSVTDIQYQDSGGDEAAAPGATIAVTLSGAVTADAVVVLTIYSDRIASATVGSWTPPAGWTAAFASTATGSANGLRIQAWTALGSVASFTFTKSGIVDNVGWEWASFTGVNTTTPIDSTGTVGAASGSATVTAGADTVVNAGAWVLIVAGDLNKGALSATGFVDRQNASTVQSAALLVNSTAQGAGTVVGPTVVTSSASATGQIFLVRAIALRPAVVAASSFVVSTRTNLDVLLRSWQAPDPPPVQRLLQVAPLTLAYGDQPPPGPTAADVTGSITRLAWEPSWVGPPPLPGTAAWNVPVVVSSVPPTSQANLNVLVRSWAPPDPLPWQRPLQVAPLALVYGQQPPPYTHTVLDEVVRAWQPPDPQPLQPRPVQIVSVDAPPPTPPVATAQVVVLRSWQPPDPLPAQRPLQVAPLTLTYGQQPPAQPAPNLPTLLAAWQPPWTAPQTLPGTAAWNVPVVVVSAPPPTSTVNLGLLVRSWAPPDPTPGQRPLTIAPLTLVYGQQPSPAPLPTAIRASWEPPFVLPQVLPGTAAWNIPPAVVSAPPPTSVVNLGLLVRSWTPPDPLPSQRPLTVAPLTLAYGQQPPPWSAHKLAALVQSWAPPWTDAQHAAPVAPLTLVYGQQPPPSRAAVPLAILVQSWVPPPPPPRQLPRYVLPGWSVDLPPRVHRAQVQGAALLSGWWQPGPPLPGQLPPVAAVLYVTPTGGHGPTVGSFIVGGWGIIGGKHPLRRS